MAEMGKYCKAYLAGQLREYPQWKENLDNLRKETRFEGHKEVEVERDGLKDEDVLYVQENFIVTDGIFIDENIIFDDVTDEWKAFCGEKLAFEIPEYEPIEIPVNEEGAAEASSEAPS